MHTTTEKYDDNVKGGYFRFDDDNNMSYRYFIIRLDPSIEVSINARSRNMCALQGSVFSAFCISSQRS